MRSPRGAPRVTGVRHRGQFSHYYIRHDGLDLNYNKAVAYRICRCRVPSRLEAIDAKRSMRIRCPGRNAGRRRHLLKALLLVMVSAMPLWWPYTPPGPIVIGI